MITARFKCVREKYSFEKPVSPVSSSYSDISTRIKTPYLMYLHTKYGNAQNEGVGLSGRGKSVKWD